MRPPKFHPNRSIDRRVIAFPTFLQYGGRPPSWILKILICDYVIVIEDLICCCVPNVNKIGSRVRPPDAHNCRMFNAPLLGNGRCHGNRIMADMSGTRWDTTTQASYQSVYWLASYGISNIFQHGGRPPFLNLKKFNIWSRDCCCGECGLNLLLCTEFHPNWFARSASRRP